MATEKTIPSAAMSFGNQVTDSTASVLSTTSADQNNSQANSTTEQVLYPRNNLLKPQRTATWRTTDPGEEREHAAIAVDLGHLFVPSIFALVNCNLGYSAGVYWEATALARNLTSSPNSTIVTPTQILLQGSNLSSFSGSTQDFKYTLYDQDFNNKVLRFYLDKDESGVAMPAGGYRFWRVVINAYSSLNSYVEIGQIWLGGVVNIAPEIGSLGSKQKDPSVISTSYAGAQYVDKLPTQRSIALGINHLPDEDEAIPLQKLAASGGTASEVLLDISAWSSSSVRKASDTYYGRLSPSGFNWSAKFQRRRTVNFAFEEAI